MLKGPRMHVGPVIVSMVAHFEGERNCPYWDSYGKVWTEGYGETLGITAKSKCWTAAFAKARLAIRLDQFAGQVWALLKRRPSRHQFGAMVSMAYNVGIGNFAKSEVLRQFNLGNFRAAAAAFSHFETSGGVKLPGLVIRRGAESRFFLGHDGR